MDKPIYSTSEERRAYVDQVRASFQASGSSSAVSHGNRFHTSMENFPEEAQTEEIQSTLGIRTIIAILIFAAFVYCDQEQITYRDYTTKEVFAQIKWDPLPIEELLEKADTSQPQSVQ